MSIIHIIVRSSWALFAIFLILIFTLPKMVVKIIGPTSIAFIFLWVLIGTGVYKVLYLYKPE
jgi:hypothetical protein